MSRRDPLLVSGIVVLLLFLLTISLVGRMFLFMRFMSTLLLLATLVFAALLAFRLYFKGKL